MQYLGLGDLFSGFIDRMPELALRIGDFLLKSIRKLVMNPWGFVTVIVGSVIAIDLIDEAVSNLASALSNVIRMANVAIVNFINSIHTGSCSPGDILCSIENGLLYVTKLAVTFLFGYIIEPISYALVSIFNSIAYVAKLMFHSISKFLCNYVLGFYQAITASYAAYRVINWIGLGALRALTSGKVMRGLLGSIAAPFVTFFITYLLSNALLNLVLNFFGINCQSLTLPAPPQPISPKAPTQLPTPSIGDTATYSLYTKSTGAPPQVGYVSAKYAFTQLTVSTLKPVVYEDASYSFTTLTRLPVTESIGDYAKYGFTVIPPAFLTLALTGTDAFTVESMIIIPVSLNDTATYMFRFMSGIGIKVNIADSASYSLGLTLYVGCSSSGTSITCLDSGAVEGQVNAITASDNLTVTGS